MLSVNMYRILCVPGSEQPLLDMCSVHRQGTHWPCCDMSFKTIKDVAAHVPLALTRAAAICSDTLLIRPQSRKEATTFLLFTFRVSL